MLTLPMLLSLVIAQPLPEGVTVPAINRTAAVQLRDWLDHDRDRIAVVEARSTNPGEMLFRVQLRQPLRGGRTLIVTVTRKNLDNAIIEAIMRWLKQDWDDPPPPKADTVVTWFVSSPPAPAPRPESIRGAPCPVPTVGGAVTRAQITAWLANSSYRYCELTVRVVGGHAWFRLMLTDGVKDVTEQGRDLDRAIRNALRRWMLQDWDKPQVDTLQAGWPSFVSSPVSPDRRSQFIPAAPPGWVPATMPDCPREERQPAPAPRPAPAPAPTPPLGYHPPQYGQPPYPWGSPFCPPGQGFG